MTIEDGFILISDIESSSELKDHKGYPNSDEVTEIVLTTIENV